MFQQSAPGSPQGIKFGILSLETQVRLAELLILSQDSIKCVEYTLESQILELSGALQKIC